MRILLFSVGSELFAAPLSAVEESLDTPVVRPMPGSDDHALGVCELRGRHIAAYSPAAPLNVSLDGEAGAALVLGGDSASIVLLVSDVDDVVEIDPSEIRIAPGSNDPDGILLGVFQHGGKLVSFVDPHAISDFCLASGARR